MRLQGQRDGRHRHQHPGRPQRIAAQRQAQRQADGGPQRKQLPGIGAGLVGLTEIGQQAADAQQRQQGGRQPLQARPQRGHQRQQHGHLQQRELADAAQQIPVGRDPEDQTAAEQGRGTCGHRAWQPASERIGRPVQLGELLEPLQRGGVQRLTRRQLVEGQA